MREVPSSRLDVHADNKRTVEELLPELIELFEEWWRKLSPLEAQILLARKVEGLTWDEMSERFHVSRSTIQRWVRQAISKLGPQPW